MSKEEQEETRKPSVQFEEHDSAKGEEVGEEAPEDNKDESVTTSADDDRACRESIGTETSKIAVFQEEPTTHEDEESTFIPPEIVQIHDDDFHSSMHYLKMQLQEEDAKEVDMEQFRINEKDSNDPSYTHLVLPYRVICRQRYRRAGATQRSQFIKEIKQHELLQSKALDGVRIHREFCNAIISQPKADEMIRLTDKQKQRLEWIMQNEIL